MKYNSDNIKLTLNKIKEEGILEAIGDGISIQDTNFRVIYQNQAHKQFVGEHLGEFCCKAYEKREHICDGCPVAMAFKDGKTHIEERSAPTEKGISYFEITASPLRDNDGQIIAGIEIARDITENKKSEEELRESEHKYRLLFENLTVGFALHEMIYDEKGNPADYRFLEVNPAFERLTSIPASTIVGKTVKEVLPNTEQYWIDVSGKVVQTGEPIAYQNYSRELGRYYDTWLFRPSSDKFAVVFSDITPRKKAEKERERLNAQMKQKNKELEQIVYVTSHDLRSPLINIDGYSMEIGNSLKDINILLQNERVPTDIKEKISAIIENDISVKERFISNNIDKMSNLLSGLLQLSRIGSIEINKEKLNMNNILSEINNSISYELQEAKANLEISELPSCIGDKTQVIQVFSNLISNAIKNLDPKRLGSIKVVGYKEEDRSIYCVEDNGIGIAPEHHKKIFEIFYRLNPSKYIGDGLGLTIIQKILNEHDGKIWLESELCKGSKFFVSLKG